MKKKMIIVLALLTVAPLAAYNLNIKLGAFHPLQQSDLWEINLENLTYNRSEMTAFLGALEFEYPLNRYATIAFEIGSYKKTILTEYRDYEYADGKPIEQNFSLKIVPYEIGLKIYPLAFTSTFSPYINFGGGLYHWKFHQWGEFINFENDTVKKGDAYSDTISFGLYAKGGLLFRFQRSLGISVEGRYQWVKGELSDHFQGFEKFDLSGWGFQAGINLFF